MDLSQYVIASGVLIGFVNIVKLGIDRNWRGFSLAMTGVIAGTIFGALHWFLLPSAEIGFALAVGASGLYEVAQRVGGK